MRFARPFLLLAAVAAIASPAVGAPTDPRPVTTVPAVDLQRYQGTWKEVASIPQPFSAECARNTMANYTLLPDGLIRVLNSCDRADGSTSRLEGRARVVDPASPAKLQVTFAQQGGQFFFTPGGDYWIIGLDPNYRWAVVGDGARKNGFVLSRTSTVAPRDIVKIVRVLVRNGYDLNAFKLTPQTS